MVSALTILALLEVFMTVLSYFEEGRVKVTYIIDTVLVVILTEVMVFWFKEIEYTRIIMVIALVAFIDNRKDTGDTVFPGQKQGGGMMRERVLIVEDEMDPVGPRGLQPDKKGLCNGKRA